MRRAGVDAATKGRYDAPIVGQFRRCTRDVSAGPALLQGSGPFLVGRNLMKKAAPAARRRGLGNRVTLSSDAKAGGTFDGRRARGAAIIGAAGAADKPLAPGGSQRPVQGIGKT